MRQDISAVAGALSQLQEVSAELAAASGYHGPDITSAFYFPEIYLVERAKSKDLMGTPVNFESWRNTTDE